MSAKSKTDSSALIIKEENFQRKFHRVDLPILVELNGETYRAQDWSAGGISLSGLKTAISKGDTVSASLILPMADSKVSLSVQMQCCHQQNDLYGFELLHATARQKRILRHYVEMAVEGRLDSVDDLIAITTAPLVGSPIQDALTFSELEQHAVDHNFKKHTILTVVSLIAVVLLLAGSIFYSSTYRIEKIGITTGTLAQVPASVDGTVSAVLAPVNSWVEAGAPLFSMDTSDLDYEIPYTEALIENLEQVNQAQTRMGLGQNSSSGITETLLLSQRAVVDKMRADYQDGQRLFEQRLINKKDLNYLEGQYNQAKAGYEEERLRAAVATEQQGDPQSRMALLNLQLAKLQEQKQSSVIAAPVSGKLITVNYEAGKVFNKQDVAALIEQDVTPVVSIRILSDEAIKLSIGMKARIYAPLLDTYFSGHVTSIGYSTLNADAPSVQEASLGETLVRIEFDEPGVRLPANSRVRVWIRTFEF